MTLPGHVWDKHGVPIYPGDLVRRYHFRDRRGRVHWLYHVAVMNLKENCMEMVPVSELEPTCQNRGGRFWLLRDRDMEGEVIYGNTGCIDFKDRLRLPAPAHTGGGEQ